MKSSRATLAAFAFIAALAFASVARAQAVVPLRPKTPPVTEGMEAPDFSFVALDGKQISLADYRGKLVLLVFWSTG